MTDDVDAFLFGAQTVIKKRVPIIRRLWHFTILTVVFCSPGINLSGNKSKPALDKKGKASKHHVWVYTADAIQSHPGVRLTRGGLILFALLNGGDYHTVIVSAQALSRLQFTHI